MFEDSFKFSFGKVGDNDVKNLDVVVRFPNYNIVSCLGNLINYLDANFFSLDIVNDRKESPVLGLQGSALSQTLVCLKR